MSGLEPVRPEGFAGRDQAARMAPLLRELALLRERESELLRRMAELLEQSSRGRGAVDSARDAAVGKGAPQGDLSGDASTFPGDDPAWIDRTIDAVLVGAFSADPEPEETELLAVDLLLLRSGETWVGMPWNRVTRLGLSDDVQPVPPRAPLSLREILGLSGLGGRELGGSGLGGSGLGDRPDDAAEPYCLTWETAAGPRSLCCEVLGGVLAASAAAAREIELVWLPDDSEAGGRLLPLVEFFASIGRDGRQDAEAPEHRYDDPVRASFPSRAMTDPPFAESPPAPTHPSPVMDGAYDPESGPRTALPAASPWEATSSRCPEQDHRGARGSTHRPPGPLVGSHSALVSVRYLPARVAISRALRSHGWVVLEAANTEELPGMLQRIHHNVVFIEAPERPDPGWITALARAQEGGTRVIGVASRLRGTAGDPWPAVGALRHLLYPFQEAELDRLIESPAESERG